MLTHNEVTHKGVRPGIVCRSIPPTRKTHKHIVSSLWALFYLISYVWFYNTVLWIVVLTSSSAIWSFFWNWYWAVLLKEHWAVYWAVHWAVRTLSSKYTEYTDRYNWITEQYSSAEKHILQLSTLHWNLWAKVNKVWFKNEMQSVASSMWRASHNTLVQSVVHVSCMKYKV